MLIPYQTAKFKSANNLAMVIWDPIAKFKPCQYFQLYSISKIWMLFTKHPITFGHKDDLQRQSTW